MCVLKCIYRHILYITAVENMLVAVLDAVTGGMAHRDGSRITPLLVNEGLGIVKKLCTLFKKYSLN